MAAGQEIKGLNGRSRRVVSSRYESLVSSGPGCTVSFSVSASLLLRGAYPRLPQRARRTELL